MIIIMKTFFISTYCILTKKVSKDIRKFLSIDSCIIYYFLDRIAKARSDSQYYVQNRRSNLYLLVNKKKTLNETNIFQISERKCLFGL